MAEAQILYMGTSKVLEIRKGGEAEMTWDGLGKWTNLKTPGKGTTKKVKYSKKTKSGYHKSGTSGWSAGDGKEHWGTKMPKTATRTVNGVERTCDVRYRVRGWKKYQKTAALKKENKMKRTSYTKEQPYQYQLQYKDKVVPDTTYSEYKDVEVVFFFADHYYDDAGEMVYTTDHIRHPSGCNMSYSDVRRNLDTSNSIASDGRDNSGSYVLSNVRANVLTLELTWTGVEEEKGETILQILNPSKNSKNKYENYITVQYLDPATGTAKNSTFYADGARNVSKYPDGTFKEISATLVEV